MLLCSIMGPNMKFLKKKYRLCPYYSLKHRKDVIILLEVWSNVSEIIIVKHTLTFITFLYKMMKGWVITKCWLTFVQWAYSTETVIAIIINHNSYSSMPWWIAASKHSLINIWIGLAPDRKKWTSVLPKESKTAQIVVNVLLCSYD